MFDPKLFVMTQMRYEEECHDVQYERIVQWRTRKPSLRNRLLIGIGRLLVRWGTALERRYGHVSEQAYRIRVSG